MFFSERIKSIKPGDRVLEIGPGATPHFRSDLFLELHYENEKDRIAQSGYVGILKSNKPIIYYDGLNFPFEDNEFDYVICSHVVEHVIDVDLFIKEMTRVAKRGYLEYPTSLYDYLYDFKEHLNFCFFNQGKIFWGKKSDFELHTFKPITSILYKTLVEKHYSFVDTFRELFFQGFEWEEHITTLKTKDLNDLIFSKETADLQIENISIPTKIDTKLSSKTILKDKLKKIFRKVIGKPL